MTNELHPGEVLTAETVGLLEAGDLIRNSFGARIVADVQRRRTLWVWGCSGQNHMLVDDPTTFTFIGRPNAEGWIDAPVGGWKTNPVPGCAVDAKTKNGYHLVEHKSDRCHWQHILSFRLSASDEGRGSIPAAPSEPDVIECETCHGSGKIVEEARTTGANQHSACQRDCDDCCNGFVATHPQEAASVHGEGAALRAEIERLKAENRNLRAVPWPRSYIMERRSEWKRLLREVGGYIQTCRGSCGSDMAGRDHAIAAIKKAQALLDAAHPAREDGPAGQWHDIATAPKDGTKIIGQNKRGEVFRMWWHEFEEGFDWQDDCDSEQYPTHWMPLPVAAPTKEPA